MRLIFILAVALLLGNQCSAGQQPSVRKLTLVQVEQLVSNHVPDSTLQTAIKRHGLAFTPTPGILDSLRAKGVGQLTLAAVEEFSAKPGPADATPRTQATPSRPQMVGASTGPPGVRTNSQDSAAPASQASVVQYVAVAQSSPVYQEDKPLAMRDLGLLHVVLKSIREVAPVNQPAAIHVTLEFTSRDSQNVIGVAINGDSVNRFAANSAPLRAHVTDDQGGVWNLPSSGLFGVAFVRAGVHGRNGMETYEPTEVGRLLRLGDDLGRYSDDPADGYYANADSCGNGGCNTTFDSRYGNTSAKKFFPYAGNRFVMGYPTSLGVGQSLTVTMNFVPQAGLTNGGQLLSFQFQTEIVVGKVGPDGKRDYQLHNLTFNMSSQSTN